MRTSLEFRSAEWSASISDDAVPVGETVANLLETELPKYGFAVSRVVAEDWGWLVQLDNPSFPLWIGCGSYAEWDDGLLIFIRPDKPHVRRWFRRLPVAETVERLAEAVENVIRHSGKARDLRWWSESENASG